jgi:hypothetical protein
VDVLWVADGKYFLSPGAQSVSILEGDKRARQREILSIVDSSDSAFILREGSPLPGAVPMERIAQNRYRGRSSGASHRKNTGV